MQVSTPKHLPRIWRYILVVSILTVIIGLFSLFMAGVASLRNDIAVNNFNETSSLYNGELNQQAPKLMPIKDLTTPDANRLSSLGSVSRQEKLKRYVENSNITKTVADVRITADFVKKGLEYQPTFKTRFATQYVLKNSLNEESLVGFEFPFPVNIATNEISNVKLTVDGVEVSNAKVKLSSALGKQASVYTYPGNDDVDGLRWEGKVNANAEKQIMVTYETVGIARFNYQGFANNQGAQDFKLSLLIEGTRSYDVNAGLTVDKREFGQNSVQLTWDKQNLFSTPVINVVVADKLAPSSQVARIYLVMAPIYLVFVYALIWLGYRNRKQLRLRDIVLMSFIYTLYFPLLHYFVSFTIDPTMEVFANLPAIGYFSMSLLGAFALALGLIGSLMLYLLSKIYGRKFAFQAGLPSILMFLGFFPLVVTIPEYSVLMLLIGALILTGFVVRTIVQTATTSHESKI